MPRRNDSNANVYRLLRSWLREAKAGRRWLVIIDNADNPSILDGPPGEAVQSQGKGDPVPEDEERRIDYFPVCEHGTLLLTTRSRDAALRVLELDDIVQVNPMDEKQACVLLLRRLGDSNQCEHRELSTLSGRLDYMPLALTQAASYIRQRVPKCSVQEYIQKLDESDVSELRLLSRDYRDSRRDRKALNSILLTWKITFEHVRQTLPSAADLLSLMSFFDRQAVSMDLVQNRTPTRNKITKIDQYLLNPERIKAYKQLLLESQSLADAVNSRSVDAGEDVLQTEALQRMRERMRLALDDPLLSTEEPICHNERASDAELEEVEDDLQTLRNYSLIAVTVEPTVFKMHRLVQRATQHWLEENKRFEHWAGCFMLILYNAHPKEFPIDLTASETAWKLYPHLIMAWKAKLGTQEAVRLRKIVTQSALGHVMYRGRADHAQVLLQHLLNDKETTSGDGDDDTLRNMAHLGVQYVKQSRFIAAERVFAKGLEQTKGSHGLRSFFLCELAVLSMMWKRTAEAERLMLLAVATLDNSDSEDDFTILDNMNMIAYAYDRLNRHEQSEQILVRALSLTRKMGTGARKWQANAKNSLAITLRNLQRYKEAEEMQVQGLEMCMTEWGEMHLFTVKGMENLARIRWALGQSTAAINLAQEYRTRLCSLHGPDSENPDIIAATEMLRYWKFLAKTEETRTTRCGRVKVAQKGKEREVRRQSI